jgi:hydrogenase nickel incorporation protein HypA/HybF
VTAVHVAVGGLTHVEPENLKFWYEELTKGTRLAGSALLVEKRPTQVQCRKCGREFSVVANSFVCAACGVADVRLATGGEVILESIEVEE